jgi:hypothetical protein
MLHETAKTEAVDVKATAYGINGWENGLGHERPTGPNQILEGWQLAYKMSKGLPSFGMVSHVDLPTLSGNFGRAAEIVHVKIVPFIPVVFVLKVFSFIFLTNWQAEDLSLLLWRDSQDLEPAHVAIAAISAEHLVQSSQV